MRITGDSNYIWNFNSNADLIIPTEINKINNNFSWNKYLNLYFNQKERFFCLLQIHRISKRFLQKLDELFINGINGQDESIYGSVCNKFNFQYNSSFLKNLIGGIWHTNYIFSKHNSLEFEQIKKNNKLVNIFHPIKPQKYNSTIYAKMIRNKMNTYNIDIREDIRKDINEDIKQDIILFENEIFKPDVDNIKKIKAEIKKVKKKQVINIKHMKIPKKITKSKSIVFKKSANKNKK